MDFLRIKKLGDSLKGIHLTSLGFHTYDLSVGEGLAMQLVQSHFAVCSIEKLDHNCGISHVEGLSA